MRLSIVLGLAFCAIGTAPSSAKAGRFTGPLPEEFQFGCWRTHTELDDVLAQYARRLANGNVAAARALWQGQSRRDAANVLKFVSGPAPAGDEFPTLRREVETAIRPDEILKELKDGDYRWGAWLAYLRPHKDLVPALLSALKERPDYRWETILALGGSRDPRAVDPLLGLLKDKDYRTAGDAAYALGLLGDPKVEPVLIDALAADSGWLRLKACQALNRVGTSKALPSLEKLANSRANFGALNVVGMARAAIVGIESRHLPRDPVRWPAGPPPKPIATLLGHLGTVSGLAFSPDGKRLASVGEDEEGRVWDPTTAKTVTTFPGPAHHWGMVTFVGPGMLASAGNPEDGSIRMFDAENGRGVDAIEVDKSAVSSLVASADGRRVAASGYAPDCDETVRVFEVGTRKEIATLAKAKRARAFSPDGKTLVTLGRSAAGDMELWDMGTTKVIATLHGHTQSVQSAAFSADGRALTTGGDWTVRLWDLRTFKETATFRGDSDITSVAFAPDGRWVAAAEANGLVRLWDVRTKRAVAVLAALGPVAFSPNGRRLATTAKDGPELLLWDLPNLDAPRK